MEEELKQKRKSVARNITAERKKNYPGHGGKQRCAKVLGLPCEQWTAWENCESDLDAQWIKNIAKRFKVSIEYLQRDEKFHALTYKEFRGAVSNARGASQSL